MDETWRKTFLFIDQFITKLQNLVLADLQWFNFPSWCSDVEAYCKVSQYTVTSLLGVVTVSLLNLSFRAAIAVSRRFAV